MENLLLNSTQVTVDNSNGPEPIDWGTVSLQILNLLGVIATLIFIFVMKFRRLRQLLRRGRKGDGEDLEEGNRLRSEMQNVVNNTITIQTGLDQLGKQLARAGTISSYVDSKGETSSASSQASDGSNSLGSAP